MLYTPAQVAKLRAEYAKISTIDPCGDAYPRLTALLDGSTQEQLKQLAGTGIKFISKLAANRVRNIEIERRTASAVELLEAMQHAAYEQPIGAWFGAISECLKNTE